MVAVKKIKLLVIRLVLVAASRRLLAFVSVQAAARSLLTDVT